MQTNELNERPEGFCTHCGVDVASFDNLTKCPKCGTSNPPCSYANQVNVSINTHELRVLCIWAENWGNEIGEVDLVYAIATRLRKQLTDRTLSLTMADEFEAFRRAGIKFETNHPSGDIP